jgi:hypothetical protein
MFLFRIKQFLKYNNAATLLVLFLFISGASVFAAPQGRQALGAPNSRVEGVDNTYFLSVNLEKFKANYRIEKIEADDEFYYVLYTYNDLVITNGVWQEMAIEKTRKITKKNLDKDLGLYLAGQLSEENAARIAELKQAQDLAKARGPERRVKVTEYSGLIGKALNVAGEFTGYEPVKKVELPSPILSVNPDEASQANDQTGSDNIKSVYDQYLAEHPEIAQAVENISTSSIIVVPAEDVGTTTNASSTVNF